MSSKNIIKNYYLLKKLSAKHKICCVNDKNNEKVTIKANKKDKIIVLNNNCIVNIKYGKFIVEF